MHNSLRINMQPTAKSMLMMCCRNHAAQFDDRNVRFPNTSTQLHMPWFPCPRPSIPFLSNLISPIQLPYTLLTRPAPAVPPSCGLQHLRAHCHGPRLRQRGSRQQRRRAREHRLWHLQEELCHERQDAAPHVGHQGQHARPRATGTWQGCLRRALLGTAGLPPTSIVKSCCMTYFEQQIHVRCTLCTPEFVCS